MSEANTRRVAELASGARPAGRPKPPAPDPPKPRLVTRKACDIEARPVDWLWPGRIPFGMLTEINGDPGQGKSTITAAIAALASTGRPFPGSNPSTRPAVPVFILNAEDDPGVSIRPKLEAAGADLGLVDVLECLVSGEAELPLVLPAGMDLLRAKVEELKAGLVVIDPLTAFIGGGIDTNTDSDVRAGIMYPLKKLAEQTGAAVLLVRHLNKGQGKAVYRGGGSIAFTGAVRAAFAVGPHPDDDAMKALVPVKFFGPFPPAIAYRVESAAVARAGTAGVAWWGSEFETTADEVLAAPTPQRRDGRRADAEGFLRDLLAGGPRPARECIEAAHRTDIAKRTLDRARAELGVVARPDGFGGPVMWRLPDPPAERGDAWEGDDNDPT